MKKLFGVTTFYDVILEKNNEKIIENPTENVVIPAETVEEAEAITIRMSDCAGIEKSFEIPCEYFVFMGITKVGNGLRRQYKAIWPYEGFTYVDVECIMP